MTTERRDDKAKDDAARRLERIAATSRAPAWLKQAVETLARAADKVPPIEDRRAELPEFIYRH